MMSIEDLKKEIIRINLFDQTFYINRYQDVSFSGLDPLDHFVQIGISEHRQPSPVFDPKLYIALNEDVNLENQNAILHYIQYGYKEGRRLLEIDISLLNKINESGLFDSHFYAKYYSDVEESGIEPLYHFFRNGLSENRRPSIEFDPYKYLEINSDVRAANVSALEHYILYGVIENRSIYTPTYNKENVWHYYETIKNSGLFDINFYISSSPLLQSRGVNPILHYILEGNYNYHDPSPLFSTAVYYAQHSEIFSSGEIALIHYLSNGFINDEPLPSRERFLFSDKSASREAPDRNLAVARMEACSYFTRFGFSFEPNSSIEHVSDAVQALSTFVPLSIINHHNPDISIIIPMYGQIHFVLSCIDSIVRHKNNYSIEIIVADDTSPDEKNAALLKNIPYIKYIRNNKNMGFLDNCNEAARKASGNYIVLLNSDTRIVNRWLDEMIQTFDLFPKAGFVGSKLVNGDGTLQEAGGLYWSDGTAWNYGRGGNPYDPRFAYARQVDWVSGASIAVPKSVWNDINGFDPIFKPAYCEDVDLAFRIREKGFEVWYQPLSCALHFEGMTHGRDEKVGIKSHQVTNLVKLQRLWKDKLPGNRPGGSDPDKEANRSVKMSMLVIDALTHTPDQDAGSAIGWQMLKAFREIGFKQTYFPLHGLRHEGRYTEDYQRLGVEMLYAPFVTNFEDFISSRNDFDYVLTHRYNVTQEVIDLIRTHMPLARIIFVPADLHHLRISREAELKKDRSLRIKAARAKTEEIQVFAKADCSVPHTQVEKEIIRSEIPHLSDNIVVLPWAIEIVESQSSLQDRHDIMYLGGYNHPPNVDAVEYFIGEVYNKILNELPDGTSFLAVGNAPPAKLQALASESVIVTGHVPDVSPYFARTRVFVAPLRFGAGIKGKVIQSLAHGVPVVASTIALEGIGLTPGENCLKADTPEEIGDAVLYLFRNPEYWSMIRESGLKFVLDKFSWDRTIAICESILDVSDQTWISRESFRKDRIIRKIK